MKIASYTVISELNVQLGSILKALAFPNEKLISVIKMQIENLIKYKYVFLIEKCDMIFCIYNEHKIQYKLDYFP